MARKGALGICCPPWAPCEEMVQILADLALGSTKGTLGLWSRYGAGCALGNPKLFISVQAQRCW